MTRFTSTTAIALAASLAAGTALAAGMGATATTDLNIRSGPGPTYPAIGTIAGGDTADLIGCADGSKWCQVSHNGKTGWSYSDYLAIENSGERYVVTERRDTMPSVTYETTTTTTTDASGTGATATTGAVGGAIAGALIGGPIGAAVGGAAGAAVGASVNPPQEVTTYVTRNQPEPVYLEGEVVVGAGVPQDVTLRPVPDYEYQYAYVNGQPVLIDPQTRQIVHVYR